MGDRRWIWALVVLALVTGGAALVWWYLIVLHVRYFNTTDPSTMPKWVTDALNKHPWLPRLQYSGPVPVKAPPDHPWWW